jgi:hypothetical protein
MQVMVEESQPRPLYLPLPLPLMRPYPGMEVLMRTSLCGLL